MTTMAQHEHIFAIMCLVYFVVGLPVAAKETQKEQELLSLLCCLCFEKQPRGLHQPSTGTHIATSAL